MKAIKITRRDTDSSHYFATPQLAESFIKKTTPEIRLDPYRWIHQCEFHISLYNLPQTICVKGLTSPKNDPFNVIEDWYDIEIEVINIEE